MKRILVVDDRADIRDLLEAALKIKNCEIVKAESGDEAIKIAKKEKPELNIMDVMMPGDTNGLEACRILKENPGTRDSKIIMLSGKGQRIDRQKGFEVGADDYFVKPFSLLKLMNKVEEIIGS